MKPELQALLHHPGIWRGVDRRSIGNPRTGFRELDRQLPGRGWPRRGLVELLLPRLGIGELQLLLPSLQQCRQCWVAPPRVPYAPALARAGVDLAQLLIVNPASEGEAQWALEQVLQAGSEERVLGWCRQIGATALRRLQLAAESADCPLFLFRPAAAAQQASPAVLRLYLDAAEEGLYLRILKCRGGQPAAFVLPWNSADAVVGDSPARPAADGTRACAA